MYIKKKCLTCEKEHNNPKFCSSSCSIKWSNKHRVYKPSEDRRIKKSQCKNCGVELLINIRADSKKVLCINCKKEYQKKYHNRYKKSYIKIEPIKTFNKIIKIKKIYLCKYCGQEKCLKPNICNKNQIIPGLIKYFGFDETCFGSMRFYEEFERIKNKLIEDYYDNMMSLSEICKKYNHKAPTNIAKIFHSLGIELRNFKDSVFNAVKKGILIPSVDFRFKTGWHITWNGKKVFYRSSYELDYCKELDEKKIDYEMETLRILYWDSQLLRQRIAIPDFYLKKLNEIVEIKGFKYDPVNMKDKVVEYRKLGYNTRVIYNHKEIDL